MSDNRIAIAAATVTVVALVAQQPVVAEPKSGKKGDKQRPNVVFILLDDAGYGDFGCYGQTKIETPNIDALAERGVRFTDMYAGAPVSAPSRCTLLTGLHSGHAQIRSNDEMTERGNVWSIKAMRDNPELEGQAPLAAGTTTLATVMKRAGYSTAMIGKWGLGGPTSNSKPTDMGFDYFYGYLCQRMAQCYFPPYLYNNEVREYTSNPEMELGDRLDAGADPYDSRSYEKFKGETYSPDAVYSKVEQFVEANVDNEFFLMWTTTIPHSALTAPDEWVAKYVAKFGDEEPVYRGKGYFPTRYPKATYAAMISYLDYQIGSLVELLKAKGLYDNTIIMVTSDNGPTHNAYTNTDWFDCAHPFRSDKGWTKRSLHEGGIRMPFIVAWGDKLQPALSDYIGYFPDVMPTLCDIAGVESPQTDGISFLPTLRGRRQPKHDYLYWEFPKFKGGNGWLSVRMGRWKALVEDVADGNTQMQLYDITTDVREETDLAADYPEVVASMWRAIKESHTDVENPLFRLDIKYPELE
ncbi:MAG: arylsulfatase [Rikenellaceae bacterium]|nr:arylsulfatase [Rikenellaceae bacterium]